MDSFCTRFNAILLFSASVMAQSFGKLIAPRHELTAATNAMEKITSIPDYKTYLAYPGSISNCNEQADANVHLPDHSDKLESPYIVSVRETAVTVRQIVELEESAVKRVYFHLEDSHHQKILNEQGSLLSGKKKRRLTYEATFTNLRPNSRYTIHTGLHTLDKAAAAESPGITFTNTFVGERCFQVERKMRSLLVNLHRDLKGCENLPNEYYRGVFIQYRNTATKFVDEIMVSKFPSSIDGLVPHTEYELTVCACGSKIILWNKKVRTLRSAPPAVTSLEIYGADPETNSISLRWLPPNLADGEIESYHVSIDKGSRYLVNDQEPGRPLNLTAIYEGHGVVKLTWAPPTFPVTKITTYRISVEVLQTDLENSDSLYPMKIHSTVSREQKDHSVTLALLPSTNYTVSVAAVNRHRMIGTASEINSSVPPSVGFASKEPPQVRFDGSLIEVEFPGVVNATRNTTVKAIVKGPSTCTVEESSTPGTQTRSVTEWDAAVYQVGHNVPETLKIFVEQNHGVTSDCSLHHGEFYTIVFVATDRYSGKSATLATSPILLTTHNLAFLAVFPVLAVVMVAIYVWDRNSRRVIASTIIPEPPRRPSYLEIIPLSLTASSISDFTAFEPLKNTIAQPESDYASPIEPDSCLVSTEYFEEYAKRGIASGLLYSQFMMLRRGLTRPCEYGRLPQNMPKNSYKNLIAYDENRVVLKKIPGNPYSDYINASYIRGYKKERAYIATQGPKSNTVNDFWRMIWQEQVRVICMLTNVTEGEKIMCEKYWPDVGTRVKHGDIIVSNTNHQVFVDYTFRTFELIYRQDKREVTHLHYTGWPSLGVPTYPPSLGAYLKKLEQTPAGNGPVVVHCSTGCGRTGTIILCDICLRQAGAEEVINVTAVITRMRDSRANMVGTLQQYLLAHIVITECLANLPTQIPCNDAFQTRVEQMRTQLLSDVQRLNDTVWQEEALHALDAPRPPAVAVLPDDEHRELVPGGRGASRFDVFSSCQSSSSSHVNAVSVDGVRVKKQYLACRLPLPIALSHFWSFVAERNVKLIILLQCSDPTDPTCRDIVLDKSVAFLVSHVQVVRGRTCGRGKYFTEEKLRVTDTSKGTGRTQSVTVLTCKGWGRGENEKPPTPAALVSLWQAAEKILRKEGQTLVLCHDGITGCGLYLALSILLDRMAVERECDVISAVRAVRRSGPEFVRSLGQFEYLYDAAVNYVKFFQTYANFS